MAPIIKGKDVLDTLIQLNSPAKLDDIVEHLLRNYDGSKTALIEVVKATLEAGVQHGYIEETDSKYHTEFGKAKGDQDHQQQTTSQGSKETEKDKNVKSVMSVKNLHSSSESVVMPKNRRALMSILHTISSEEDEPQDQGECCGSRYRSSRRSRSRSGKRRRSRRSRRRRRE